MRLNPPVLIIAYSRPNGVEQLIEESIKNDVTSFYVSIDGPKPGASNTRQLEILEVVNKYRSNPLLRFELLVHPHNLGVGVAVIRALDWFFSCEEVGHVLEDDLILNSGFFDFSRKALSIFEEIDHVRIISGTQLRNDLNDTQVNYSTNYPMIWGWSTWRSAWLEMREGLLSRKKFSFTGKGSTRINYWATGANRVLDGKVDTWDTPLAAEFNLRKWQCIMPPVNLICNAGDDSMASHTSKGTIGLNREVMPLPQNIDFAVLPTSEETGDYNVFLEQEVFKIRFKHYFLPLFVILADRITYREKISPLSARLISSKLKPKVP
jgi:hypothetical protein